MATSSLFLVQLVGALMLFQASAPGAPPDEAADPFAAAARKFLGHLAEGQYERAAELQDATMSSAMPAAKLEEFWKGFEADAGPFKSFGEVSRGRQGGYEFVFVECVFRDKTVPLKVVLDQAKKVSGLWVTPPPPPGLAPQEYSPPAYDHPDHYTEERIEFGEPRWLVKGVLWRPKTRARAPAVVLVHGSGPHDEDETIGPNKPLRDLAAGLASNGIAVLRYPKRTLAYRMQLAARGTITVREEVIDDALAAVRFLRNQPTIDPERVYVIGHSLGASLAGTIAQEDPKLAGIVLLAGSGRDFLDVLDDQLAYIAGLEGPGQKKNQALHEEVRRIIANLRADRLEGNEKILNVPVSYWQEVGASVVSSFEAMKKLKCRMLILGGGRDYQVTRKDFDLYASALKGRPNVTLKWLPKANHLFFSGKQMATPNEYGVAGHVDRKVVLIIARWITDET